MTTPRYGSYPQTQFSTGRVQLAQLNFASYVKPLPLIPNLQKFFSVKHFFQSVNPKCQVYNCGLVERERKYSKTRDHSLSLLCLAPLARICKSVLFVHTTQSHLIVFLILSWSLQYPALLSSLAFAWSSSMLMFQASLQFTLNSSSITILFKPT